MTKLIDTPKALLLEVPEGSYWFELDTPVKNRIVYALEEKDDLTIDLPTGYAYDQPILAGEMSEEDWKEVVQWFYDSYDSSYDPQYNETTYFPVIHNYETSDDDGCETFTESGQSLLRSHNMKPETTVVVPKKKNP